MTFEELETVVLACDLPDLGLRKGDLGAVVHVREPGRLEVELVLVAGRTQAVVTLRPSDVRGLRDEDLLAVRTMADDGRKGRNQPWRLNDRGR
jgi:hypothetical protein